MRVAFVPIDNRPVCYTLPEIISKIDSDIEFFITPRSMLGDLTKSADIKGLFDWLFGLPSQDAIILSLDTLAYGGLIPSRRCSSTFEQIRLRLETLNEILKQKNAKIYAFSSIMRISNNNYNQEEKEYWQNWGKMIFEYSYNLHKNGVAQTTVPDEILNDYITTRERNFEINKLYLNWDLFDTLVFSKDDCAKYGLNVLESQVLESMGGVTKTGADEIPLSLLARAICKKVKICPIFLEPESENLISNYEDVSIKESVRGQIELAGCKCCEQNEADILLFVNNFKDHQGEIVMGVDTESFAKDFEMPDRPYMIADVRFANGADNEFVKAFFKNKINDKNFYGYSAWNTSANSLGSLICGAKFKFLAKKYDKNVFQKLQVTRFLDDWAYQANVRQTLVKPDLELLCKSMKKYELILEKELGTRINAKYSYPWNRLFEVEVELN